MHVLVNGVRLFFDVEGASHVPDGPALCEKPTLLLLHGGPGMDHSMYKPFFSQLADIAQVIYLDHRGNGRSDAGARESWTLQQWADDVHGFCLALGIEKPIVWGTSFGGMVALAYATRFPDHPSKLILVSTEAAGGRHVERKVALFGQLGGPEVGSLARRRFVDGDNSPAAIETWLRLGFPHYTRKPRNPDVMPRVIRRPEVTQWFAAGEARSFDLFPLLHRICCPTLILGGELDPMIPIESQADIAAALEPTLVQFERFANCGHAVVGDVPELALPVIRQFIQR